MDPKILIITQARIGSGRLPSKVLRGIGKETLLSLHLKRILKSRLATKIIVATTLEKEVQGILKICDRLKVDYFQGSTEDVLDRFYQAAKDYCPDWIVRLTSDCPLLDPELVDDVISFAVKNNKDYATNTFVENFPDGQDVEVFKYTALKEAWENATLKSEREHVTPYIRKNSDYSGKVLFTALNYDCESDYSNIRMTVDEIVDLDLIKILVEKLGINKSWETYTNYIIDNDLGKINDNIIRNEGLMKSLKEENNG